jgi:hypothetical protein
VSVERRLNRSSPIVCAEALNVHRQTDPDTKVNVCILWPCTNSCRHPIGAQPPRSFLHNWRDVAHQCIGLEDITHPGVKGNSGLSPRAAGDDKGTSASGSGDSSASPWKRTRRLTPGGLVALNGLPDALEGELLEMDLPGLDPRASFPRSPPFSRSPLAAIPADRLRSTISATETFSPCTTTLTIPP